MESSWHIERDGKKHGPHTSTQMQQMAVAGNLLPSEMVLEEGTTTWRPASEVDGFFPALKVAQPPPIPVAEAAEWHFSQDGSQSGPVTMSHLKGMAENGHLRPADLVWKAGMSDWVAVSSVQGIFPPAKMPPPLPRTASQPSMPASTAPIAVAPTSQKEDPEEHSAYIERAKAYEKTKNYVRAIEECTEAIKLAPANSSAYVIRGSAHRMKATTKAEYDIAIADLDIAISIDRKDAYYPLALRGTCFSLRASTVRLKCQAHSGFDWFIKEYGKGIADLVESLQLRPDYTLAKQQLASAYTLRAEIYFEWAGNFEKAIADCTGAIRLDPANHWAFALRGVCYNDPKNTIHGDAGQAVVDLTEAIRLGTATSGSASKTGKSIRYGASVYESRKINYKSELEKAKVNAVNIDDLTKARPTPRMLLHSPNVAWHTSVSIVTSTGLSPILTKHSVSIRNMNSLQPTLLASTTHAFVTHASLL